MLQPAAGGPLLRLLSYNVRSLRDDRAAAARVVRACRPDVVCIQEAPRFWRPQATAAAFAAACGLRVVTAGRPPGAMLLLAAPSVTVRSRRSVRLSWHPPKHRRGLALGEVEVAGARWLVGSFHLDLDVGHRLAHLPEVWRAVSAGRPEGGALLVLAGDVNETPDGPVWAELATRLQDCGAVAPDGEPFTYSTRAPRRRIDGVFADPRVVVVGCGVPVDPALDADPGGQAGRVGHERPGRARGATPPTPPTRPSRPSRPTETAAAFAADVVAASDHRPLLAVLRPPLG